MADVTEPVREKRFHFRHEGADGRVLEGQFLYRRASLRDLLRIEAEKARLTEGQSLGKEYQVLAAMLAHLRVVLREVPKWLDWDTLDDVAFVMRLHEEVSRYEASWFRDGQPIGGGEGARPPAPPQ